MKQESGGKSLTGANQWRITKITQSQSPRRKQRGIKLETPQGSGDLVYAPLRSVLFAEVFTRVKAKMWQKIDGYTKMR